MCQENEYLVFVLKDNFGNTFGGFFTHKLEISDSFYGTGESFLFKMNVIF